MSVTSVAPEIGRDRYGRPLVVPPNGGKAVPYSRCTSYIDVLEDKFNLQQWEKRMVALGLADRPDLMLAITAHRDDKGALNRICNDAKEAAKGSAAATTGTALHALTEVIDRGEKLPTVPASAKASLDAYAAATADLKSVLIEQFCVLDTLKIGGTPDRVVEYGGERYIADLKTGSISWGALKIAMQLAVYARSKTYDIGTGERGIHEASTSRGIVIHLPSVEDPADAICELHWFDLEAGWYAVQTAKDVREKRAMKFRDLTSRFGPVPPLSGVSTGGATNSAIRREKADLATAIRACTTADSVRVLWASFAREWTDDLTAIAMTHIKNLPAN